ncbi:hypothetical protein ACFL0Y_02370 [Patescibacteria group bacterium]
MAVFNKIKLTKLFFLIILLFIIQMVQPRIIFGIGPEFISTFESIGIYWSPAGGSLSNQCQVQYRVQGSSQWKSGHPLWYDNRLVGYFQQPEYRGSLVHLQPGTTYEIKLSLNSGDSLVQTVTTWSENFPVANTQVISSRNSPLVINDSGGPNGYLLYDGQGAQIDVNKQYDHNIIVNGSYVIVRGFVLKGANKDAIEIGQSNQSVHHVVIEDNMISQWGSPGDYNPDLLSAGIRTGDNDGYSSQNPNMRQFIIQRNRFFDPSIGSTYWDEDSSHSHPSGPMAIALFNTGGNHVIRYNEAFSRNGNYFMDILGAGANRSFEGFPASDTDIYSNFLSHGWDDGIEAEGGNRNVRIWGNYIDKTYVKIAIASTTVGPLYIWRNVSNVCQKDPNVTNQGDGAFIKAGGNNGNNGRVYIFHNTLLQPPGSTYSLGCRVGIGDWGGTMVEHYSLNNIFQVRKSSDGSIEGSNQASNVFDYDLYNGLLKDVYGIQEIHGLSGTPSYAQYLPGYSLENLRGDFSLSSSSLGFNEGVSIPGFNNSLQTSPDIGAHEAGTPPMEFGINAYQDALTCDFPSDIDCDGTVNVEDLRMILSAWGSLIGEREDVFNDFLVNIFDASTIITNWSP